MVNVDIAFLSEDKEQNKKSQNIFEFIKTEYFLFNNKEHQTYKIKIQKAYRDCGGLFKAESEF